MQNPDNQLQSKFYFSFLDKTKTRLKLLQQLQSQTQAQKEGIWLNTKDVQHHDPQPL